MVVVFRIPLVNKKKLKGYKMLADSVRCYDFACFKNGWAGFDSFEPVTLIIGRNNTGKSRLLDLVEIITSTELRTMAPLTECSCTLNREILEAAFPNTTSGGILGSRRLGNHGVHFLDKKATWNNRDVKVLFDPEVDSLNPRVDNARVEEIYKVLSSAYSPISRTIFRRILADRDIQAEPSENGLELAPNGVGATNIIRRFITSSKHNEELIQETLLEALGNIFGSDGNFSKIEIREHDEGTERLWEVFLGEPNKGLVPLSSSGSGLKTVILVLLNLLVIPKIEKKEAHEFTFAFEELENNLHPALLRRLFKYLTQFAVKHDTHVFLTTHSSVALDFFGSSKESQILHVSHDGESAKVKTISAHFDQIELLNELGAKPSDLLQANGIIWLEGPSDRIYFNRFIELFSEGELREGREYQCAYYGGSVLASTAFTAPEESKEEFVNLLRLNNNIAVVCDGDRTSATSRIKGRVKRIKDEVAKVGNAYLWITEAKEIENYVPGRVWKAVYSLSSEVQDPSKFDSFPTSNIEPDGFVFKQLERKSFDKCEFASKAVKFLSRPGLRRRFEFETKINELVSLIHKWNE